MTGHPAIYHRYVSHDINERIVNLENGISWQVRPKDISKLRNWMPMQDDVVIAPARGLFSAFPFRLINIVTKQEIQTDLLISSAARQTDFSIREIDLSGRVLLSDGTLWDIAYADRSDLKQWHKGDYVLIGINDSWFSLTSPNILIHLRSGSHVRGCCLEK